MQYTELPDEQLAAEAADDRQEALAALYDRYLPVLYDLARRLLRSNDEAVEVCRLVFASAHQMLDQHGPPPSAVRTWLFALLHREVTAALRRSPQVEYGPEEPLGQTPPVPPGRETPVDAEYREIALLVWQAVRELRPEDQELVLFHVRNGLDAPEIAEVLGRRPDQTQAALAGARETFEAIVTALIVLNKGRRSCQVLDDLAYGFQQSPRLIDQVVEHVGGCQVCQQTRRRYVSGAEVLAGLVPVPVPSGTSGTIWRQIMEGTAFAAGATTLIPLPNAAAGFIERVQEQLPWERLRSINPVALGIAIFLAVTLLAFFAAYAIGSRVRDSSTATPPTPQRLQNVTPISTPLVVAPPPSPTLESPTVTSTLTAEPTNTPAPATSVPVVAPTRPPDPPTVPPTAQPSPTETPRRAPTPTNAATPTVDVSPSPEVAAPTATGAAPLPPAPGSPVSESPTIAPGPPASPTPAQGVVSPTVTAARLVLTAPAAGSLTRVPTATLPPAQVVPTLPVIIIAPIEAATPVPSEQ